MLSSIAGSGLNISAILLPQAVACGYIRLFKDPGPVGPVSRVYPHPVLVFDCEFGKNNGYFI